MRRTRTHSEISATEFLARSLVGAGVFLAIPAALVAAFFGFMLIGAGPHDWPSYLGVLLFCLLGFALLFLAVRTVRHPERVRHPRILWASAALYLGAITATGVWWLVTSYVQAREGTLHDWSGENLGTGVLLLPGLLLFLPFYAFILAALLCALPHPQAGQARAHVEKCAPR